MGPALTTSQLLVLCNPPVYLSNLLNRLCTLTAGFAPLPRGVRARIVGLPRACVRAVAAVPYLVAGCLAAAPTAHD